MICLSNGISFILSPQNWFNNLTPFMNNPAVPSGLIADFTSFIDNFKDGENIYGIPFEAFLKSYVYRTDRLKFRQLIEQKYNRLAVPTNWERDYTNIAKFFTEYGKEKGIELYGHIARAKTHPCVALKYVGRFDSDGNL